MSNSVCAWWTVAPGLSRPITANVLPQREANLRILGIESVRSVPYVAVSHPFVERLIGAIRREYLDRMFFWNRGDLEQKLEIFAGYYNAFRVHQGLGGRTPEEAASPSTGLCDYSWQTHCNGLFELPIAA